MVMGPHPLPRCVTSPARPLATAVRRGSEGLPLRWRLALGYALMLLLVLAPLAALQASTIHTLLYNDASATLTAAAQAAVTAVRPPPSLPKARGRHPLRRPRPRPPRSPSVRSPNRAWARMSPLS